jgi:hypothetical protein
MLRGRIIVAAVTLAAICLSPLPTAAHHSVAANYDRNSTLVITGTITEVDMRNPHSQITLDVIEDDGTVVEWFVEWADKNALVRRLVEIDRLRVGEEVTITGLPNRRLPNITYFRQAVLPDGSILTDCGFRAFRESLDNNIDFTCEPPE